MNEFLKKFCISESTDAFEGYYSIAKQKYKQSSNEITDFEKYGIFTYMKDDIKRIRDGIIVDADNVIYCYFLAEAIKNNDKQAIKILSTPQKHLKDEKYDLLPLFSLLYFIPQMKARHKELGIPEDVTNDTCNMFENQVQDFIDLNHRYGISHYVGWMLQFINCEIIRIGRFNFEWCKYRANYDVFENCGQLKVLPKGVAFHKSGQVLGSVDCEETEGSFFADIEEDGKCYIGYEIKDGICTNQKIKLDKDKWKKVVTQGDDVISVHIPCGGKMTSEICDRDIARSREIFSRSFGNYKAFYCESWLLDPQIKQILGKETNLTKFADRFEVFPRKSDGKDVFEYVYLHPATTPPEDLPETTSFAGAVKKHLVNGKHIYGSYGVFL